MHGDPRESPITTYKFYVSILRIKIREKPGKRNQRWCVSTIGNILADPRGCPGHRKYVGPPEGYAAAGESHWKRDPQGQQFLSLYVWFLHLTLPLVAEMCGLSTILNINCIVAIIRKSQLIHGTHSRVSNTSLWIQVTYRHRDRFLKDLSYFFERQLQRGSDKISEKKMSANLLSTPQRPSHPMLGQTKAESLKLHSDIPREGQVPKQLAIWCCFHRCIGLELDQKWNSRDLNWCLSMGASTAGASLSHFTTTLAINTIVFTISSLSQQHPWFILIC